MICIVVAWARIIEAVVDLMAITGMKRFMSICCGSLRQSKYAEIPLEQDPHEYQDCLRVGKHCDL